MGSGDQFGQGEFRLHEMLGGLAPDVREMVSLPALFLKAEEELLRVGANLGPCARLDVEGDAPPVSAIRLEA